MIYKWCGNLWWNGNVHFIIIINGNAENNDEHWWNMKLCGIVFGKPECQKTRERLGRLTQRNGDFIWKLGRFSDFKSLFYCPFQHFAWRSPITCFVGGEHQMMLRDRNVAQKMLLVLPQHSRLELDWSRSQVGCSCLGCLQEVKTGVYHAQKYVAM